MSFLQAVVREFQARRLWAVALVLLLALIAVPVVFSKSPEPAPAPGPAMPPGSVPAGQVPALSVKDGPLVVALRGGERDPFTPQPGAAITPLTTGTAPVVTPRPSTTTSTSSGASSSSRGVTSSGSSGSSSSGSASGTPGTGATGAPVGTAPAAPVRPRPVGLAANQVYAVTLAITTPSGGLDTIDPLVRLRVLPGPRQPLLVFLGVLKGGGRVLFAVQPGAGVRGAGVCIPGPIDCEVLSLAQDQIETLLARDATGALAPVSSFAVTAIVPHDEPSVAAAQRARRRVGPLGRRLLQARRHGALAFFRYEPALGAIVDLRNVAVGAHG